MGSNISILQPGVSRRELRDTSLRPFGVTGETLDVKGRQLVSFMLEGRKFDHMFLVCPLPTEAAGLIGTDFLDRTGAEINFECGRMALAAIGEAPFANSALQGKRTALTLFSEVQVGCSTRPTGQEELHLHEKPSEDPHFEMTMDCSRSGLVQTTENITVAPRCRQIAMGRPEIEKSERLPSIVCVEPALIPIQGVLTVCVLTWVEMVTPQPSKVTSQTGCVEIGAAVNRAHVVVANFSDEPLTIPKCTVTGVAEPVSENLVNLVNSGGQSLNYQRCLAERKETKRSIASCYRVN